MTTTELKKGLREGKTLGEMFEIREGQECEMFKAREFVPGNEIIYIPDLWLNDIPANQKILNLHQQDEIVSSCYTGDDFIATCEGDEEKARRLFAFCDWQHPSSAHDAGEVDDE